MTGGPESHVAGGGEATPPGARAGCAGTVSESGDCLQKKNELYVILGSDRNQFRDEGNCVVLRGLHQGDRRE